MDRAGVGVTDWRALAGDYPELPALRELAARHAAGDARADGYAALERRALAQAQALDEIIEDARAYLATLDRVLAGERGAGAGVGGYDDAGARHDI